MDQTSKTEQTALANQNNSNARAGGQNITAGKNEQKLDIRPDAVNLNKCDKESNSNGRIDTS